MSDIQTEYLEGRIHELENTVIALDHVNGCIPKLQARIKELEEAIRDHRKQMSVPGLYIPPESYDGKLHAVLESGK